MDVSNVFFVPSNMYGKNLRERARIINLVTTQAPPMAVTATIVNGWHTSRSDKRAHCTVDYFDAAGARIGRRHIV
ncbi:hypothetical protein ACMYSQ_008902 [Aspergillus niger]